MRVLLSLLLIFLAFSTRANEISEKQFYLKVGAGGNVIYDMKGRLPEALEYPIVKSDYKIRNTYQGAVGYYVNDKIRSEISLDYHGINCKHYVTDNAGFSFSDDGIEKSNIKGSILSVMSNNYYTLYTHKNFSIFIGATIGLAQIKERLNNMILIKNHWDSLVNIDQKSYKTKNINFAYGLIFGSSYKVADSADIDVSYSWKDFGRTNFKTAEDGITPIKNRHKGHIVTLGLRFDT